MSAATPILTPELFEQHFVLRPPYPWGEVVTARKRLSDLKTAYEEMEKDKNKVVAYKEVLKNSGRILAAAICVAAHLRRYSNAPNANQRFLEGLSSLSTGLGLQSLDETSRGTEIERCFRDIGLAPEDLPNLDISDDGKVNNSAAWSEAIGKLLQNVNQANLPDPNDMRRNAWTQWEARLSAYRVRNVAQPIDIDFLRCLAEGSEAGRILPARLDTVTLGQVTDALTTALASTVSNPYPNVFALGLLAFLGFDLTSELLPRSPDDSVGSFLSRYSLGGGSAQSPLRGLLIIRVPAGSLTNLWRIDPQTPTLNTTADAFTNLFEGKFDLRKYLGSRFLGILLEIDRVQTFRDEVSRCQKDLKRLQGYLPNVKARLLVSRPVVDANIVPAELRPAIVSPANPGDAMKIF
jgi:hypothetical protein